MRISTKTRYGMRFMIALASSYGEGRMSMKDISDQEDISKKYLEQVASPLAASGLLKVTRGQKGGFELSRPPEDITLAEVVSASEGGIELLECLGCLSSCDREEGCASKGIWEGMQNAIIDYLEDRTLADVVQSAKEGKI